MFERLSTKLIGGFSLILVLSIAVNLFAIFKLSQVQDVAVEISENWMPSIYEISTISANTSDHMIRQQQHIFALSEIEMSEYEGLMRLDKENISRSEKSYKILLEEREDILTGRIADRKQEEDPDLKDLKQNKNNFKLFQDDYKKYLEESEKIKQLSRYNNKEEAKEKLRERSFLAFESSNQTLNQIIFDNFENAREAAKRSEEIYTNSSRWIIGFTIVSIMVSILVAFFIVRDTRKQIGGEPSDIAEVARRVSAGDLTMKFTNTESEESIYSSVKKVVENLREVSNITNNIAKGDLSRQIEVKSSSDLLAISINQMIENFKNIINQAQVIAKGDYTVNVKERGEEDELSAALQLMTESLRTNKIETFEQNWIKDGINQLAQQLSGNLLSLELSRKAINFISRYTESAQGVMYLVDNYSSKLKLNASYAFTERSGLSNEYKIGEGLVGQVGLERSPILLKNIRRQDMSLSTGTVEEPPTHVYAFPLVFEYELYGVIELASFEPFTQLKQEFLQQAANTIVTYIYSVLQTDRIKGLLATSEEATRSAQARAQEIEQANARLEVQQGELQEKSEELRRRNESLISAKEELDRRAEQLELSNKYKSEFLANMSHELRTPLNSIIMLSKMLSKNEKDTLVEKDVKKAKIIYKSGGELLRLINDILDLSKIEAGKMVINPVEFANREIVTDMNDLFQGIAQEKGIQFVTEDKTKSYMYSDKERLAQILRNFLSNAFKFTKKGQVKLSITDHDEDYYRYSISDTGIGIPKDKQQVIFEAFKQADGTTSREYGGTGLGLSIARELTKLLQGHIELDSEAGKGSTFSIVLPKRLDEELAEKEDRVTVVVKNFETGRNRSSSQRRLPRKLIREDIEDDRNNINKNDNVILIIEDEVQFAESMAEVLHSQNIKTLIAQSGEEGIDLAMQYKPSGIILDLGLPDIDGTDVLRKLKSYKELRHIPIEIISARDKDNNLLATGAFGFLQKPIDENVLKKAMSDMLRLSHKKVKDLLVVEDDESQMEAIKELIIGDDVKVTGVKSQKEAIDAIENGTFDGAIVDLGLKDGSGQEVCKYINENHPNIPVIIYTGKTLSHEEETNLRQAAQSIILKTRDTGEKLREEVALFLHRMEAEVEKETPKKEKNDKSTDGQKTRTAELAESLLAELQVDKELEELLPRRGRTNKNTEKLEGDVPPRSLTRNSINEEINGNDDDDDQDDHKNSDDTYREISKEEAIKLIKNKTILVVDDDIRNIFVIASALETYEAQILEAMNGQQAIDMLREEDIDLVLMDSVMPEMNGLDAMRLIRQDKDLKHYAIVAITGKAQEEDKQECFDAGANDYIVKPVDYDQLIYTVCKWIGKRV